MSLRSSTESENEHTPFGPESDFPSFPHALSGGSTVLTTGEFGLGRRSKIAVMTLRLRISLGLLKIHLPKTDDAKNKQIKIKVD